MALETAILVGVGASIYQQVDAYQQEKANAKYNSDVAEANARQAEMEAKATEAQAAEQARRLQIERRRALSAMRAQYGASGAALDSGSPLAQLAVSAGDLALRESDTLAAGKARADSLRFQSGLYRSGAKMARLSSPSVGSLIGGLTSTAAGGAASLYQANKMKQEK